MDNNKNIELLKFEPLNREDIKSVYRMCNNNVLFINQSFQTFEKATLGSKQFDPKLSIVASDTEGRIAAFFMIVFRRSNILRKKRKVAVLKFFVVDKEWRYNGLGSKIFLILSKKNQKIREKMLSNEI